MVTHGRPQRVLRPLAFERPTGGDMRVHLPDTHGVPDLAQNGLGLLGGRLAHGDQGRGTWVAGGRATDQDGTQPKKVAQLGLALRQGLQVALDLGELLIGEVQHRVNLGAGRGGYFFHGCSLSFLSSITVVSTAARARRASDGWPSRRASTFMRHSLLLLVQRVINQTKYLCIETPPLPPRHRLAGFEHALWHAEQVRLVIGFFKFLSGHHIYSLHDIIS
jgi:hypothetical protein